MYFSTTYSSPIGLMTLACQDEYLVGVWLEGQKYHGGTLLDAMTIKHDTPIFTTAKQWLDRYFAAENPAINDLPLAPMGSEFRQEVWRILCKIPYGNVISYGDIAKQVALRLGKKSMSSQAVGGAVGHNPISVIIPCHRVVGSDGSLTGYAGGIDAKIKLLELEQVDMSNLFIPQHGTAL